MGSLCSIPGFATRSMTLFYITKCEVKVLVEGKPQLCISTSFPHSRPTHSNQIPPQHPSAWPVPRLVSRSREPRALSWPCYLPLLRTPSHKLSLQILFKVAKYFFSPCPYLLLKGWTQAAKFYTYSSQDHKWWKWACTPDHGSLAGKEVRPIRLSFSQQCEIENNMGWQLKGHGI